MEFSPERIEFVCRTISTGPGDMLSFRSSYYVRTTVHGEFFGPELSRKNSTKVEIELSDSEVTEIGMVMNKAVERYKKNLFHSLAADVAKQQ